MNDPQPPSKLSLEDLIALNDEIAAMTRAGMPLETGLRGFAGSVSGRLSAVSTRLADRLSQGASLPDALDAEATGMPRVYRAVIAAGAQSGRLSDALQSLGGHARTMQEVRRQVSLALIYPILILVVAYYLFWFYIGELVLTFGEIARWRGETLYGWIPIVESAWRGVEIAGHGPPVTLLLLFAWWCVASRLLSPNSGIGGAGLRFVPGLGRTIYEFQLAKFCELSGLLLEHNVPAPRALRLAGEATDDLRIVASAADMSVRLERGESFDAAVQHSRFPPFLRWMLRFGGRQTDPANAFRQIALTYRGRADSRADWFKLWFPVALTLLVGGAAVIIYTLSLFLPLSEMLHSLAAE